MNCREVGTLIAKGIFAVTRAERAAVLAHRKICSRCQALDMIEPDKTENDIKQLVLEDFQDPEFMKIYDEELNTHAFRHYVQKIKDIL